MMMETVKILKNLGIDPNAGAIRAIQRVGDDLRDASDPLSCANSIITALGGKDEIDFPTARLVAKHLVSDAVQNPATFKAELSMQKAKDKIEKLNSDPRNAFMFTDTTQPVQHQVASGSPAPVKGRKSAVGKKDRALKMCEENSSLDNGAIAQLISKELSITYANAYYYVSRVWKRPASK